MSEKLRLQLNDFPENIKIAFANLKEDTDFKDVTLVCEDGQQVEAHKVVLTSSSPFFQKLLAGNKHPHPMIYMRGMKYDDLFAILDFVYRGEAKVFQENLDSFLAIAEELQLKGLMGNTDGERVEDLDVAKKFPTPRSSTALETETKNLKTSFIKETFSNNIIRAEDNSAVAIPSSYSGDLDQLEAIVKSMMEKSENNCNYGRQKAHRCKVCGKEDKGSHIKDHIEANHIEGIFLPCNICGKTFRSRNALRQHNRQQCFGP